MLLRHIPVVPIQSHVLDSAYFFVRAYVICMYKDTAEHAFMFAFARHYYDQRVVDLVSGPLHDAVAALKCSHCSGLFRFIPHIS